MIQYIGSPGKWDPTEIWLFQIKQLLQQCCRPWAPDPPGLGTTFDLKPEEAASSSSIAVILGDAGKINSMLKGSFCRGSTWLYIWGFPKIRGTILGIPIIRTIIVWGPEWGPLFWETTI